MWPHKTITAAVKVETLGMIKKGKINILTRFMAAPGNMKYKKILFAELSLNSCKL